MNILAVFAAALAIAMLVVAWTSIVHAWREIDLRPVVQLTVAGVSATSIVTVFAIAELVRSNGRRREEAASIIALASAVMLTLLMCSFLIAGRKASSGTKRNQH
jgi:hypothetical protein